jgi:hypothetical protein
MGRFRVACKLVGMGGIPIRGNVRDGVIWNEMEAVLGAVPQFVVVNGTLIHVSFDKTAWWIDSLWRVLRLYLQFLSTTHSTKFITVQERRH